MLFKNENAKKVKYYVQTKNGKETCDVKKLERLKKSGQVKRILFWTIEK